MNIKQTLTMGATALALLSLTSCAKQKNLNDIEGKWTLVDGSAFEEGTTTTYEFKDDETVTIASDGTYGSYEITLGWEWDGDLDENLDISFLGYSQSFEITELSDSDLEMNDVVDTYVFTK